MVLCQARADTNNDGETHVHFGLHGEWFGDEVSPYFVLGPGAGEPIDSVVDADPRGRYLAVIRKGRLILIDTAEGKENDLSSLGADLRDDPEPWPKHRAATFDGKGERLLYLRKTGKGSVAVVRTLSTGAEVTVDPGPGELWRAVLDETGEHVIVAVITEDRDGNGKLDWHSSARELPEWNGLYRTDRILPCRRGRKTHRTVSRPKEDRMMIRAASTSGGAARDAPGLLLPFGKSLLRRTPSGALVLDRADGEKEIVPPRCKAELLSAHLGTGAIMVACEAPEGRAILQIVDEKGSTVAYEFEKVRGRHVVPAPTGPDALVVVVDEDERVAIVDVVRRPFGQSKLEGDVLLFDRPQALLVRGEALVWWDMKTEVERILFERVERYSPRIQRGRFAYVDPVVVELPSATVVGIAGADVHALSTTGYALVSPEGRVSSSSSMRSGPLRWRWPSPAPARSPR